eukprot:296052-Chlamydomonas_euryale.AAC.2
MPCEGGTTVPCLPLCPQQPSMTRPHRPPSRRHMALQTPPFAGRLQPALASMQLPCSFHAASMRTPPLGGRLQLPCQPALARPLRLQMPAQLVGQPPSQAEPRHIKQQRVLGRRPRRPRRSLLVPGPHPVALGGSCEGPLLWSRCPRSRTHKPNLSQSQQMSRVQASESCMRERSSWVGASVWVVGGSPS